MNPLTSSVGVRLGLFLSGNTYPTTPNALPHPKPCPTGVHQERAVHHHLPPQQHVRNEFEARKRFCVFCATFHVLIPSGTRDAHHFVFWTSFLCVCTTNNLFYCTIFHFYRLCGIYKVNNSASCVVINPGKLAMGGKGQGESFGLIARSVGRSVRRA